MMQPTPLFYSIGAAVEAVRPSLIVLDNIAATFAGNQNDRVQVRSFLNLLRGWARLDWRPAVLAIDHPSLSGLQNGTGRGGNMDWRNGVRSALYLRPAEDKADADRGVRVLDVVKSNYAPIGKPTRLEWSDGVLTLEGTLPPLRRLADEADQEETFMRLLDDRNKLGRDVSDKFSRIYAPKVFAEMEGSGGFSKNVFASAMERLFKAGKIVLEPVGSPSERRHRIVRAAPV
jgi:RecA-family ATPase